MPIPDQYAVLLPAVAGVAGYLLGSLPFGFLVARARGVDIFSVGSKSPGATNVRRVLGTGPGNTVLFLDILKGAVAAGWPLALALGVHPRLCGYIGLACALLGHSFSCFTRFRGGKGVATAAGGLVVLMPWVAFSSAVFWIVLVLVFRFVSVASIFAAASLPAFAYAFHEGTVGICVSALIAFFVVIRHRANISRLLAGTEKRFERKKGPA